MARLMPLWRAPLGRARAASPAGAEPVNVPPFTLVNLKTDRSANAGHSPVAPATAPAER